MKLKTSKYNYDILTFGSSEYSQLDWIFDKEIYYNWYDITLIEIDWEYFKFSDKVKSRFHSAPGWRFEFHIALIGFHFTLEVRSYEFS